MAPKPVVSITEKAPAPAPPPAQIGPVPAAAITTAQVPKPTVRHADGAAIAALLAAPIGLFVMSITVVGSELSVGFKDFVFSVGKAWIPGASGIGPYSGKETFLLVGWLGSWLVLHLALHRRDLPVKPWIGVGLLLLLAATLLVWPPVWHLLGA